MHALRAACAEVARRATSVQIDEAAIGRYAASLELGSGTEPDAGRAFATGVQAGDDRAERAAYWLTLDAINFGSGWFPTLRKDPGASGYTTVAAAWRAHWEAEGPLSAEALSAFSAADVARSLDQDPGHELMELYALSLRDLGERVSETAGGAFLALAESAEGSAVSFAWGLGEWPCFADRSSYRVGNRHPQASDSDLEELSLPFLKRAQIAAADLARAGLVEWRDAHRLTMFADNLVPHVLRLDGILVFDPALVARIDAGVLIEHGSPEEVEIRACAVHAVELIVEAAAQSRVRTTAVAVDELLWNRGRAPRYKAAPRHRSRCTAY